MNMIVGSRMKIKPGCNNMLCPGFFRESLGLIGWEYISRVPP